MAVRRKMPGFDESAIPSARSDFGTAAATPTVVDLKLDVPEFGR